MRCLHFTSYNVLADSYTHLLTSIAPANLSATTRYERIIAHLKAWQHHVYALQEAELALLVAAQDALPEYRCLFAQRPRGKPDGLAFLVHSSVDVLETASRTLIGADGQPSSRLSQRLVVQWHNKSLAFVQAHISYDAGAEACHAGLRQMNDLLDHLPNDACDGVLLCGDWNAPPDHPVVNAVKRTGLVDAFAEDRTPTYNGHGEALSIDHIFHSHTLRSRPLKLVAFDPHARYPNAEQGSDHLPLGVVLEWTQ